jgi:Carboxysome shell peptide mid-region
MQPSTMNATGGRAASRERRAQLVQGKGGLPPAAERSRTGKHGAAILPATPSSPMTAAPATTANEPSSPATQMYPARLRITGTRFSSDESDTGECTGSCVTGDIPSSVKRVTGTQRGAERHISGTPYYSANAEANMKTSTNAIERVANGFTVRSPQLDAQLRADAGASRQPSAAGRITGTFARGEGKITGNQEFNFNPRPASDKGARTKLTGEGRAEGPAITGGAWGEQSNVTGTEGYIAAERNPSERSGSPQRFAGAANFKGKGNHAAPTQHVTGMVGWSAKTAARVTLSGGAQG